MMIRTLAVSAVLLVAPVALAGADPVNALCPIGKEPVNPKLTIEYQGHVLAFCCPGCDDAFLAWDAERRDAFVAEALAARDAEVGASESAAAPTAPAAAPGEAGPAGAPYPLAVCAQAGSPLGSMGDPVVEVIDGREVRFCCAACSAPFKKDLAASWRKVDALIVKDQKRFYPLDTCVVSGAPLVRDGKDVGRDVVIGNRLVRVAGTDAERTLRADPKPFLEKLDAAVRKAQRQGYPLETCAVAVRSDLGSMGEPTELIIGGRLLRFCCASCEPKAKADPVAVLKRVDEAWAKAGRYVAKEAG